MTKTKREKIRDVLSHGLSSLSIAAALNLESNPMDMGPYIVYSIYIPSYSIFATRTEWILINEKCPAFLFQSLFSLYNDVFCTKGTEKRDGRMYDEYGINKFPFFKPHRRKYQALGPFPQSHSVLPSQGGRKPFRSWAAASLPPAESTSPTGTMHISYFIRVVPLRY